MIAPLPATFGAGPVQVRVESDDDDVLRIAANALELFSTQWKTRESTIGIAFRRRASTRLPASGTYLTCARMTVDRYEDGFAATALSGIAALGRTGAEGAGWVVDVPPSLEFDEASAGDIEDLISLFLTVAWRECGWQPVHAGAVTKGSRTLMLCAPSGGGKSTLTAALVRSGWVSLGDDKLLLGTRDGAPAIASLMHTFNLHPRTASWFRELGELDALPRYSAWTPKRRVALASLTQWQSVERAMLTDIVRIERTAAHASARIEPLPRVETLPALLRQIVIPADVRTAERVLRDCSTASRSLWSHRLEIGEDAYAHVDVAAVLSEYFS